MKTNLFALVALIFFYSAAAQQHINGGGIINLHFGNNFKPAEITYTNGTVKSGLIKGFIENNTLEFGDFSGFDNFEGYLNLDDKNFYFKETMDGESVKLSQNDVKQITLVETDRRKVYRLLNILTVKNGKEIIDLKRPVWLPLLQESKNVSIYGFNMFINGRYIMTQTYLSKDNINAIMPIDKMAGMKTINEAYKVMLHYVFNNCEKMTPSIEGFMEKALQDYKMGDQQIKDLKKDKSLSKDERQDKELSINQSKVVDPFVTIINEYNSSCI